MSVNITVNGKFAKHCRPYSILDDPKEIRKAEEKERRKLRLLQVREESKKLAKKIRDEVNEEKKRELQKLQAIKEKELECWRQHALQRKGEEYREAIFQIGTAHQAAKRENEQRAEKQKQGTYKDFKKQMAARKSQPGKVQFSCQKSCVCQQTLNASANKQFKCTCTQTDETHINDEAYKRKRDLSFSSSESECEDEGYKEQTTLPQTSFSFSSTCDSTSSSLSNTQATQTSMFVPTKNKCLIKTPAVYLDVEVGTDDSVTISAPAEVKDKHAEYNRQFSSVIRVSPRKAQKEKENTCENPSIQQSSTTNTLSSESTAKKVEVNKSVQEKSQIDKAAASKEKRFTIISDLVKKQQGNELSTADINQGTTCPPVSQATSTSITPHLSPRKQIREVPQRQPLVRPQPQSPRKASATSKSSRTITDHTQPATSFTATTKSNTAIASGSSSSGRVQFYDYNSKLAKERDQAPAAVSVQRQGDQTQPTAMEQAELEKQRERERQLEALKRCQQMEERGQKALEREQVRRDCNELTEKLEALTREYPNQLPTNENQLHLFADKQLRKESKMNTAVEKLLQRPTIITCSELNNTEQNINKPKSTAKTSNLVNELNVAALNNKPLPADDVSSDSCCSILLGYVDDQSRLVKQDLQSNEATQSETKQKRLQNLLKRLDQLRTSLVEELKNESESKRLRKQDDNAKFSSKEENLRQVIDSISEMRKEREQLLTNGNVKESKPLKTREKELQAKEAILEQKVREFYELQKQQNKLNNNSNKKDIKRNKSKEEQEETSSSSAKDKSENSEESSNNKENVICASGENPLEIIITVKGETKCVKIPQKPKRKMLAKKSPSKLSTLIRSPQTKKHTPKKKTPSAKPLVGQGVLRRQNSYDSNSTSYMSLPSEMPNKIDDLTKQIAKERQQSKTVKEPQVKQTTSKQDKTVESEISLEPFDTPRSNQPARINPLIAQYVQRLLGMSRNAVEKLGVSSSEIETPGSSIINTTGNITNSDTLISDERLISIHNFMEENRSFIKDLEQSMRTQNNVSLENSMRMFDDIWRKRLKGQTSGNKNKKTQDKTESKEKTKTDKLFKNSKIEEKTKKSTKDNINQQIGKPLTSNSKTVDSKLSTENLLKDLGKSLSSHYSSDDKESLKSLKLPQRSIQKSDKAIDARLSADSSKNVPDSQIARYAKLTENCTHRIAELTELINRVREEKQRLLEVTLSSVSDNGRQSTEYLELPEGKSSTRNDQEDLTRVSSSSEETTHNKQSRSSDTLHEMPKLTSADKNKQITASRDSGIAESRPITALENRIDQEPISQTSSESTMPQPVRKLKPPPTLKRFSPQLPEEELAHELSTILEVDTPATSRINTAAGQSTTDDRENASDTASQQPVKFPTFEQYIKQLDLDITQLNPEQSVLLQQEFTTFLECLQTNRSPANPPQYTEFPSISAYIQHLTETDHNLGETMEESLAQLRISGINPRNFPAVREYMKSNASKLSAEQEQLLDTESLENITEEPTRTNTDDTASLDIEAELKRRKILKNSFRYSETKQQQIFSSTAHKDAAFFQEIVAAESGVDKLSTSGNTSDLLDADLKRMVQQWPGEVRRKSKEIKILSSTTTSANASAIANSALRAASLDDSSKGTGQALNLRDFLTRELLKHANITGSSSNSSSDESLRSHFLHSLIGSLTPRTPGAASKSGAMTLDRQKTSTPVPMQSSQTHSSTSSRSNGSSQLFSGESRLSSVHYQDRSVRFFTSDGDKADQSSE
ncbi:myosin-11 [Lucilia sericata]|uniref:myosin-11 n=1 Tax=Lucilia sericata TaxID=13632 RepID=UPI0018A7F6DF|nr:myosin-11 [Lucilia sericata]